MSDKKKGPLRGVVACLTGMSADQKDQYHSWIETLGGQFTRDFHTTRNTHLIAETPQGEKYDTAMDCSLHVVKPSWLEACHAQTRRVSEDDHSWKEEKKEKKKNKETKRQDRPSLLACLEKSVVDEEPNSLFSGCQFLLVGFDNNTQERVQLSRILRNGMGTIFWEYQEHITHVIVHDHCDDTLRGSVTKARLELFGDFVTVVSPWWVADSWQKKEVQSPKSYPPSLTRKRTSSSSRSVQSMKKMKKDNANNNLFRGHIFVLLRISNPHPRNVDYNNKDLEHLVRSHGGQILSLKLLETLKAEHASQSLQQNQPHNKRTCHVVCFGGGVQQPRQQFSLHPLLAQILRRELCELVLVTPNWLQTCVKEQSLVDPTELPVLFQPQPWSWRRLVVVGKENQEKRDKTIRISVTGFQGAQRTAIVQAIRDIGAIYDDSMHQKRTTHLICCSRNKSNPKFLKAQEWGITVVFVEWLYHVLQHGPGNEEEGDDEGALRFVVKSKT
jgi:twin BRCT domain